MTRQKMQRNGRESDRKREKTVVGKVRYDIAFMTRTIKTEKLQGKTHYVIEQTKSKEEI
jgi:hypothetical protein